MKPITFYVTRTSSRCVWDKPIPEAYRNPATKEDDWEQDQKFMREFNTFSEYNDDEYIAKAWLVDIYPNQIHAFIVKHQGVSGVIFDNNKHNFEYGQEYMAIEIYDDIRGW